MKRLQLIKDLAMCACIILISVGMLCGTAENRRQRRIINEKIDELASRTDAGIQNLGGKINALDVDVQTIRAQETRTENKVASMTDTIRMNRRNLEIEIDNLREELTAEPEETTESTETETIIDETGEAEPYKVGAISITRKKDSIADIDDTKADTNPSQKNDPNPVPTGPHLTAAGGVFTFEGHTETYYNLDMSVVVRVAQERGIAGEYHVRSDGAKMIGDYIMVAACYDVHPYGSLVNTSLGMGIVVDTGGFTAWNANNIDIATSW